MTIMALIFCLLALEAVRRAGGPVLLMFTGVFAIYPIFAYRAPGILQACYFSPMSVIRYHVLGLDSLLGIPMQVVGSLVIGFIVFGTVMVATGGGKFFLDFAFALFGSQRGGPAKVAVFSSGLFGSLSGSVISNIVTTGSVTIPTMKKIGYPNHYAGAIEACASTGGVLMPPVMGTTAFIMASFLNVPYFEVAIAAVIPSLLYYLGLFMQVDAYAGKVGLKGIPKSETPRLMAVLKEGWPFIFALVLLIYFLYLRLEAQAPFYAIAALIGIAMIRKETRLNFKGFLRLFESIGRLLAEIVGILAACGFIIGAFSITGVGSSFCRELVMLAGGLAILMLIFGAISSYILGMGMTVSACYIFLAIILAPGLVAMGFNAMAIHLFVLYWGVLSYITPPVALGSFVAAGLAEAPPMKTGLQSMRLGVVIYLVPFFFVYCPDLVLQGTILGVIQPLVTCIIGIILLAGGMEGFLAGVGRLSIPYRLMYFISGLLLAIPNWQTDVAGVGVAAATTGLYMLMKRRERSFV